MNQQRETVELIDYINIFWRKKWVILIPTFVCAVLAYIFSSLMPKVWKIDAIIEPSKFFLQTSQGAFNEIYVSDPVQLAGQINNNTYNNAIAQDLKLDIRRLPKIDAMSLQNTKLVLVSTKSKITEEGKSVLHSLYSHIKKDLDKKIDVEMKSIETEIENNGRLIKQKRLDIQDRKSEIKVIEIEKNMLKQEILSWKNKQNISRERALSLVEEMRTVKARIDKIEEQQRAALSENPADINTLSLLLYSNEVQNNLRYYNTLDESLSNEKVTNENIDFTIKERNDDIRKLDAEIEIIKTKIDRVNTEIEEIENQIKLAEEKRARIDYTKLVKPPTSSVYPVSPKKRLIVVLAGFLSFVFFGFVGFFIEYIENSKNKTLS